MFDKILNNKKIVNNTIYALVFLALVAVIFLLSKIANINNFFTMVENKTFDVRQSVLASGGKKTNSDIVIVAIDDASYEYILDRYGEWPMPRDVYAKLATYLEKQQPKTIAFDLMFVKSMKSNEYADRELVKVFNKNNNIFTSMNFDNQSSDLRIPITLPPRLCVKVDNKSQDIDFNKNLTFTNCRGILDQLIYGRAKVGMINVSRADDGILRKMPPLMIYQDNFYPHLALLVGLDYLKKTEDLKLSEYVIDKNSNLIIGDRRIPIDSDGGAILNWYGPAGKTFNQVPMYKLIKAMEGDKEVETFDFKDKIIYFGTTAVSLFDTKSVPVDKVYPGVEIHATYVNNIIDNNFIKKASMSVNIVITLILALLVGFVVIKSSSTWNTLFVTLATTIIYSVSTYYVMKFFNVWIWLVIPLVSVIATFTLAYIVKYLIKSRDFEYQYKLATTDGLTELYNHRYFQDQMRMQIANCARYKTHFSLIIIDIDFFKKFNDTYGHQAGDAVLRQVAQTLKKNVRSTDVVCRYGGEEMSIILTNTDKEEALFNANRICKEVASKPYKLSATQESHVTISLGVATYPQDGETPQDMIEHADTGLYYAKENGRNQVGISKPKEEAQ